jgi:hypothetical protein
MDAERGQDLHALRNDYDREGPEVLEAAIRAGRDLKARGRLRMFDLRRYCSSSIRATCIVRGREAAAKAQAVRREAAAVEIRRLWDARVLALAQELRAQGQTVSLAAAEARLRGGDRA